MNQRRTDDTPRRVRRSTLLVSLIIALAFSLLIGIIGIARGVGSLYPGLNMVAKPFVCASGTMTHQQTSTRAGGATYWNATWSCTDDQSGSSREIDSTEIFIYSGLFYGVVMFGLLLLVTHLYWNSSIGPAKNDGLRLW